MNRFTTTIILSALCAFSQAATVYTRINNKPAEGWPGTYIIVYEKSSTEALVWNGKDATSNTVKVSLSNGKITSEQLSDYHVTVTEEKSNRYYLKAKDGYIGTDAKSNGLNFYSSGRECTLQSNGGYTMLETNTNTCRFLCNEATNGTCRFRFYYDKDKKWQDSDKHNICFYVLGEVEQEEPKNKLDINYAHIEMYACESKFPTQSNPYDQYFMTFLFLAAEESDDAVPQIGLEILAPTQYSIEGTYKSDYASGKKYFINCQAGSKHSYFIFLSNAEQGWSQASIQLAEMNITKVGQSEQLNAYVYHIRLVFTDSNKKIWTLDKDLDVYAWWIDCNRSGEQDTNMEPQAFVLESGNHNTETEKPQNQESDVRSVSESAAHSAGKVMIDGQLLIIRNGQLYTLQGLNYN